MKKINLILPVLAILASMAFVSCNDDNDLKNVTSAIVTVKDDGNGQAYLQVDDNTIVKPTNVTGMPFGKKEVRALTQYQVLATGESDAKQKVLEANVIYLDSVLTKPTVPSLGMEKDYTTYGNDPIEVAKNWITVAEDGYVTIQILAMWGNGSVRHRINLARDINVLDPYEFHLCHDANGDYKNRYGYSIVAFNIKDIISESGKEPTEIHIHYTSFNGPKAITLKYGSSQQGTATTKIADTANVVSIE